MDVMGYLFDEEEEDEDYICEEDDEEEEEEEVDWKEPKLEWREIRRKLAKVWS